MNMFLKKKPVDFFKKQVFLDLEKYKVVKKQIKDKSFTIAKNFGH